MAKRSMEKVITIDKKDSVNVARLFFDEIDLSQRKKIRDTLASLLEKGERDFVIDMSHVGFVTSLVLALIVFFAKEVKKDGGHLKICGLSQEAESIFHITQFDRIFELYKTEQDAVESFKDA